MREINPGDTDRAYAFEMWMKAPMPMVTLIKTMDVTRLVKTGKRCGMKFNMMMLWCIGRAATGIREFYTLPVGDRLVQYDSLAVSTIVANKDRGVNSCDIALSGDLWQFADEYLRLTSIVAESCRNHDIADSMVIGTSALARYEIDGAVGMYSGIYNNPFLIWGKYKRRLLHYELPVSFQFHHTQMDGEHAAAFLDNLQKEIRYFCR